MNNLKQNLQSNTGVSSSIVIEPISCELSYNMKSYIEMLEWCKKAFNEARKQLMIPCQ